MIRSKWIDKYREGLVRFQHDYTAEIKFADFERLCTSFLIDIEDLEKTVLTDG